ncbi:hypothetical protein B296_00001524 [Ensete ventricosum]|uniref:Uncharacterized protein n=1 Tax=Ensete ventricosum TaxID=4639 RepID=A0A426ZP89_ENSVE|nr:hypothetical protein B296_00001524 [Ensete ventricosum]
MCSCSCRSPNHGWPLLQGVCPHVAGPLLAAFAPKTGDSRRSKGAAIVHSYGGDFLRVYPGRMIEPQGMKDKGRSPTSHAKAYSPLYYHLGPYTKEINKRRAL